LNLIRFGKGRVLVDYAHNPAAIAGLMEFIQGLDANKRIGILTAPGDRRDEDLRMVGRLSAKLDRVILREDKYRRGRPVGDTARLIREGLMEGGMREDQIEEVFDEKEALAKGLGDMQDNDLVFVLADEVPIVLEHVRQLSAELAH
ncbi:MAG: cyanophycin synthetase, partial [Gemmatimonadales bacterium]